jgi:hypothetical protein
MSDAPSQTPDSSAGYPVGQDPALSGTGTCYTVDGPQEDMTYEDCKELGGTSWKQDSPGAAEIPISS